MRRFSPIQWIQHHPEYTAIAMNPLRFLLFIGHPGHELRVFHWLTIARPRCLILTDGSGPDRDSRLPSTLALLEGVGASVGSLAGRLPDRELYRLIREGNPAPFIAIAEEVAQEILDHDVDAVAGDMIEGFNTGHDITRLMLNAALARIESQSNRNIANYEFPLERLLPPDPLPPQTIVLDLDDEAFARKSRAARESYPELSSEIDRVTAKYGDGPFRREWLTPANPDAGLEWPASNAPYYEVYGAKQVAAGHYESLITFREHIQPLAHALRDWAQS